MSLVLPGESRMTRGRPSSSGQGMDFGRPAAARAVDGLLIVPPFPPAAERCALMWVLSITTVPTMPVLPAIASNITNQMPCRFQRLKRL